jgi:DNA polymerase III epsilon subunit family exonuclease
MTEPLELGLDTETTGLKYGDHRFVEVYGGLWRGGELLKEFNQLIDPRRSIPADVIAIHHITPAMVAGKPDWEEVGPIFAKWMAKADIHIAHNANFDLDFLRYEFKRIGIIMPVRPVLDTMQFTWATPDGKKPSLKELCFACDVEYTAAPASEHGERTAHSADYDVKVMMASLHQARAWGIVPTAAEYAETFEEAKAA